MLLFGEQATNFRTVDMIGFGKSIYWKLLSFFLISITLASLVILLMFSLFGAQTEIHPRLKQFLLEETVRISKQITVRLTTTSDPLKTILDQVHQEEDVSVRIFDLDGNQRAASTSEKIQKISHISPSLIQETINTGTQFQKYL